MPISSCHFANPFIKRDALKRAPTSNVRGQMARLSFAILSTMLLQCRTAFAAADFSGQWLNRLDVGNGSKASLVETTLYIEQRGKLLCGEWMFSSFVDGHISRGLIVGEVLGNSAQIIFSDNLKNEYGMENNYLAKKHGPIQQISIRSDQLHTKYKDHGIGQEIRTFEVVYKKQIQASFVSDKEWELCQKSPLIHPSSRTR